MGKSKPIQSEPTNGEIAAPTTDQPQSPLTELTPEQKKQRRKIRKCRDPEQQKFVTALIACGVGFKAAAAYCGTSYTQIQNEIKRNPRFADAIQEARDYCESGLLSVVWQAAMVDRDTKSAQWLLERGWWQKWCKRTPEQVTPEQLAAAIGRMVGGILSVVPPELHNQVNEKVETILVGLTGFSNQHSLTLEQSTTSPAIANDPITAATNDQAQSTNQQQVDVVGGSRDESGDGTANPSNYSLF